MKQKLLFLMLFALPFLAEARTITGVVKDQTGETVISASVLVKGTTIGTVTDFDGNYTLDVPDDAKTLVFSFMGMETKEMPITGNVINVVLAENTEVLDEVVVTGYGTTKKRDLVTSVASVNSDQLKDIPVTTAAEALQGKLAGVTVTTTEGAPDAEVKIRVRGGTSITQSNDPLYIVDGFPVSSISDIPASDIASMDVLKDAAATAIYGAQGANGVIIITTKDVQTEDDKFQIHVDYTGYMGWREIAKKYDMLSVTDMVKMQYENAYLLGGASKMESNFSKYFDPNAQNGGTAQALPTSLNSIIDYWNAQECNDWQDRTFGRKGLNSNHSISITGGNKKAKFSLTYTRIDDEGIMYGGDYDRNNIAFKTSFKPLKGLTIGANVRFSNTVVLGAGTNPTNDIGANKSESRVRDAIGYPSVELFQIHNSDDDDESSSKQIYNPILTIDENYKKKIDNKWNLGGYVQYQFLKRFTIRGELGYESRTINQDKFCGPHTYYSRLGNGKAGAGVANMGNAIATDEKTSRFKETVTFEYKETIKKDHNLSALIGQEIIINKGELRTDKYFGFDPKMSGEDVFNYLGVATNWKNTNYVYPQDNMLSFFLRANYDYRGRYYATFTFRADGSSRFAKENQWGFFPSGALAWRITGEDFMEPAMDVVSNLKLRLSYGSVGNNNVDLGYVYYQYAGDPTSGYNGIFKNMLTIHGEEKDDIIAANSKLKWETTITRDLGIDFGFFNERLSGTIDLYWNTTKDLILKSKLASGGYNYQFRNIGSTVNRGVEISLNGIILDHRDPKLNYGLTAGVNFSLNRTRVEALGQDEYGVNVGCLSTYYTGTEYRLHKGDLVGDIYGYKTNGVWTADDFKGGYNINDNKWLDANLKEIVTPLGAAYPGMPKIGKINSDGSYSAGKEEVLGNALPKFNGGFNIGFHIGGEEWGNIDLATNFTYSFGNDVINFSAMDYNTAVSSTLLRNNSSDVKTHYTLFDENMNFIPKAYEGSAFLGRIRYGTAAYNQMAAEIAERNAGVTTPTPYSGTLTLTDRYVEDASYLRMSSLTVGYTLPAKYMKKAYIQKLRVFFTASNLFCVTKYSGSDPEVDTQSKNNPMCIGVDYSAYPKSRTFNFGLNLSF